MRDRPIARLIYLHKVTYKKVGIHPSPGRNSTVLESTCPVFGLLNDALARIVRRRMIRCSVKNELEITHNEMAVA
jgi:hypothetical protein